MGAFQSVKANKEEDLYDYQQICNFSLLRDDEKEKVVSLIKERVEKYSKENGITCQKHIILPKFMKVNPARYFALGYVSCNRILKSADAWQYRCPIFLDEPFYVDNSHLYSILESEILKQNKNETFTISIDMHSDYIPAQIVYCDEYEDESEQKTARFGYLPKGYINYSKNYHTINITLRKVFNTIQQS